MDGSTQGIAARKTGGGEGEASRLERMLQEQESLCGLLDQMSREQGKLIAAGDADGALAVISDRQGLIERISALAAAIEPLSEGGPAGLREPQRARARRAAERVAEIATAIRDRDRTDLAALGRQKEAVEKVLAGMARGRGALAAYGAKKAGGVFQDRQG